MPGEPLPKQKLAEAQNLKAAWDSYSAIISAADELYVNKDFILAKEKYLQAQSIKPDDEYPRRMLEKIDIALMDVEQANRSSYEFTIEKADALFSQQDYEQAMVEYNNALRFKPDADYAKQKINDINVALSLRKTQEEAYSQAISRADNLYKEEKWLEAKDEYNRAISIKPLEQYPKVKVEELNTKLADLATKRELYNNLVKGADKLFFSDDYTEAREQYREANYLFPKEQYPLDQITMINEILGIRDKYVKSVTRADQLLFEKDYEAALLEFRNAAAINPKEDYPLEKIKEIEAVMAAEVKKQQELEARQIAAENAAAEKAAAELAAAEAAKKAAEEEAARLAAEKAAAEKAAAELAAAEAAKKAAEEEAARIAAEKALDQQYGDVISGGDKALAAKEYQKALENYQQAASLKPQEEYPKGKIAEINNTLAEIAKQEEINKKYNELIASAGSYFDKGQFEEARAAYQQAGALKPSEEVPGKQIIEIDRKIQEMTAERESAYLVAITKADNFFGVQDYDMAKVQYSRALELKPGEAYPTEKLAIVNEEINKKKQLIQAEYEQTLVKADQFFTSKTYDDALEAYRTASLLKPEESYPKEMAERIFKILSERSIVQINKDPLLINANTTHKFEFDPVPAKDRKSNYIFFKARNASKKDYKLIISFGQDNSKNGGVVIKIPSGEQPYDYIVRISAQYKWFSEDNNWITFYPENGDIEVYLMQVSYSD